MSLQEDNRKRQEIIWAILDETDQLLRAVYQHRTNPIRLETPAYAKFEGEFWRFHPELTKSIRNVHAEIGEANGLLGTTDVAASMRRNDLWYNYLPNSLTVLRQELRKYESVITAPKSYEGKQTGFAEMSDQMKWDLFICHASEDKAEVAEPLAKMLQAKNLKVWYDKFTLLVGDSLRRKIDEGLANSRYGVVILSPQFFMKNWPQRELDGLAAREDAEGHKVILPVWHNVERDYVVKYSPTLADRLATRTSDGLEIVLNELLRVILQSADQPAPASAEMPKPAATSVMVQARGLDIDKDMIQMFSRFLNEFTTSHIQMLEFLDNPKEFGHNHGVKYGSYVAGSVSTILEEAIPELKGRREFHDQLVRDLHARGLTNTDEIGMHAMMTDTGMYASRTTQVGKKFLTFVKQTRRSSAPI